MKLTVNNLPSNQLAITNSVYLPAGNAKDPTKTINIKINNFIMKANFSTDIPIGKIGISKAVRTFLNTDINKQIFAQPYNPKPQEQNVLNYLKLRVQLQKKGAKNFEVDQEELSREFKNTQNQSYFHFGQQFYLKFKGQLFSFVVQSFNIYQKLEEISHAPANSSLTKKKTQIFNGKLSQDTEIELIISENSGIQSTTHKEGKSLFRPDFKMQDMGIGGLDQQLFNIFRRAFSTRRFPPATLKKFGIKHVKGLLFFGPPGTGKTLIARQLAKALGASKNLTIINGPEIFSKFVGQSEQNIRKLFAKARQDEKKLGDKSPLHVIVFDQIDAICKQRGVHSGGSQVSDQVVNQLLTNIDGVEALHNILVIGMTNRKDLLDEAILRPGRLQVHVQIKLPTEQGRKQIINIHTKKLRQNGLIKHIDIDQLANKTKNFTGAEIQALVKSATSHSLTRNTNIMDYSQPLKIDKQKLLVTMHDFYKALEQIQPQFGVDQEKIAKNVAKATYQSTQFRSRLKQLIQFSQMKNNGFSQIKTMLIYGEKGSGKTTLAKSYSTKMEFDNIQIISPEDFVGYEEQTIIQKIIKIFQKAYQCNYSCIIIDNIEHLIKFQPISQRYSNKILQVLMILLLKIPQSNKCRLVILGTTSYYKQMRNLQLYSSFNFITSVPSMSKSDIASYLINKYEINEKDAIKYSGYLQNMPIGKIIVQVQFLKYGGKNVNWEVQLAQNSLKL